MQSLCPCLGLVGALPALGPFALAPYLAKPPSRHVGNAPSWCDMCTYVCHHTATQHHQLLGSSQVAVGATCLVPCCTCAMCQPRVCRLGALPVGSHGWPWLLAMLLTPDGQVLLPPWPVVGAAPCAPCELHTHMPALVDGHGLHARVAAAGRPRPVRPSHYVSLDQHLSQKTIPQRCRAQLPYSGLQLSTHLVAQA